MSRIQDILSKAERDGTTRRTRSLVEPDASRGREYAVRPPVDAVEARGFVETVPPSDSGRARVPPIDPGRLGAGVSEVPRLARPGAASPADAPSRTADPPTIGPDATPELVSGITDNVATPGAELDHLLVAALAPTSLAAEQYRSLRTRLQRAESTRSLRTIAVTSPAKGDGKSLTVSNLALTMAQEFQQRVLLMDADLRRPTIHRLFGIAEAPGLTDVLMSAADLEQALVPLPEHQLTILPAGLPPAHPAELLGSATMRRVLDSLRSRFDRILIDVPPVAPLADLHILAPMVDGLLMIVRAGVTPKPAIERALAGLDQSKVLGLVLNETGSEGSDEYDYEGYGYLAG
jgi:protein-tyrosine kinase